MFATSTPSASFALTPLTDSKQFVVAPDGHHGNYLDYVKTLPPTTPPDVFGLHENADVVKAQNDTSSLLDLLQQVEEKQGDAPASEREVRRKLLITMCSDILEKRVPASSRFDMDLISIKHFNLTDALPSVLVQECAKYSKLTDRIRHTTEALKAGLEGKSLMSADLELVAAQLHRGEVPSAWLAVSYPTQALSLSSYLKDLSERIKELAGWMDNKPPVIFRLGVFFHPHAFLSAILQNYARKAQQKSQMSFEDIVFDFEFVGYYRDMDEEKMSKPTDGVYIRGLQIEGARWDSNKKCLADSLPQMPISSAPVILLKPCHRLQVSTYKHYECPVYRTASRSGPPSSFGSPSNLLVTIRVPTSEAAAKWLLRGVAMVIEQPASR